jgi:hypothetical protein
MQFQGCRARAGRQNLPVGQLLPVRQLPQAMRRSLETYRPAQYQFA